MAAEASRPSLNTIAAELGISRTTVSNAYNRPEQLSEELRAQILQTAQRLGYAGPHPVARSLRTQHMGTVGVLFTDNLTYAFEDAASVDFMAGLAQASTGYQTSMTLIPVAPHGLDIAAPDAVTLVHSAMVDGFVVYSVGQEDPYLEAVAQRGLPAVVCDQPQNVSALPFVGIHDEQAIAPAASALVQAGHRRIGVLCIRLDPSPHDGLVSPARLGNARHHVQRGRVQGALRVFEQAGLDASRIPIVECYVNSPERNYAAAVELFKSFPELTAVLCTTDTLALGVLQYAQQQGISVPEDLSVTGFDAIATAVQRGLSTVLQPNKEKGRLAGEILAHLLQEPQSAPQQHFLETTYIPGATVAQPRY